MADGLQTTWEVLAKTRNRAVLRLLIRALRSTNPAEREGAIRCAVRRRDADSHRLLIQHFAHMGDEDRGILCASHRALPHHMAAVLKEAVLGGQAELCDAACKIITHSHDYDLFPTLVQAAENREHRRAPAVLAALRRMSMMLHRELTEWSEWAAPQRHDPSFARRNVLAALERSLPDYYLHKRRELVEAYVLLAPCDHAPLHKILRDPYHSCHRVILELLSQSKSAEIMSKLVEMLRDTDAPTAALEAIGRRDDREFIHYLLCHVKHPVPLRVLHNLKRLSTVAWLEQHEALLEVDGRAQAVAAELAAASGIDDAAQFALLAFLLKSGVSEGRRAGCKWLTRFHTAEADLLIRSALDDPDAGVQATAAKQLRERGFSDALKMLVALLDSRYIEVREAARSSLAEFNFVRYRAMFDCLDERAVKSTGVLVHKVDQSSREGLVQELASPSASARLRGIEMAVAMEATQDVREQLISLAGNDNLSVRQEAIAALGSCRGPGVLEALREAVGDSHPSVREVAEQSLKQYTENTAISMKRVALVSEGR